MTNDIRFIIGKRLKALREEHDMTQEEVARAAGLSLHYIQITESKEPSNISVASLEKIAGVFDLELWEFLKFSK